MDGVLLLSQPGFNELTRVDRPSFTLMGWYRSLRRIFVDVCCFVYHACAIRQGKGIVGCSWLRCA